MMKSQTSALSPELGRVFGAPGPNVNAWGIHRKSGEFRADGAAKWKRCSSPDQAGAHIEEWPISELSIETVAARWGAGDFRTCWFTIDPSAEKVADRYRPQGTGKVFVLEQPAEKEMHVTLPSTSAASPIAGMFPGLEGALALLSFADQRANTQLQTTIQMAQAIGGGGGNNQIVALLIQQMNDQRRADEARYEAMRAQSEAQFAALRAELAGGDDEDDTVGSVARAAAPMFRAGKPIGDGLKAALANFVVENPMAVVEVIKKVPAILDALKGETAPAPVPAPPPPVPAPAALRSVSRPIASVVKADPPLPVTGLNSLFPEPAKVKGE